MKEFTKKPIRTVGFKKKKTTSYTKKSKSIPYTVGLLGIFSIFVLGISISNAIKHIDFDLLTFNDQTEIGATAEKNSKKLNVLVIGRGGGDHDAPDLTDTLILAGIDIKQGSVSMLSLPRDLYIEYRDGKRTGKINRLYEDNLPFGEEYAIEKLKSKVSEITGQEISHYINVDFEGFKEIIDVLDGIEVTVTENLVDNSFPDGNLGYTTFILRKGTWTLDGETALKYARSRYSTSDFDRSLRQQQIIKGIKDKIFDLGYLKSPSKTKNLYSSIRKNIKTDIDIKTILTLANTFKNSDANNIFSFNLNDSCFYGSDACVTGGLLYVPERHLFRNLSVLLPEGANVNDLSNYDKLQKYTNLIFNNPEVFEEDYFINVFNSTKIKFIASSLADNLKRFGFSVPEKGSVGNVREKEFETSILYYNGIDEDSATLENLKEFLDIQMQEVEFPLFSDNIDTKIEIVLGQDYEEIIKVDMSY